MFEEQVIRGTTQNTYQEYTYVLAANGGREELFYDFNYFRILEMSGAGPLRVRFGDNSQETPFIGTGIGYKSPFVMPRLNMRNTGATPLTVRIALAIGEITDDRINFDPAAVLPVEQKQAQIVANKQQLVGTSAAILVPSDPARLWASIQAISGPIYIGGPGVTTANGFLIAAGSTYSLDMQNDIYAVAPTAATNVCVLEGDF